MLPDNKKIYFLSDFHLGAPDHASSLEREKLLVQFLDEIKNDATEIFLVGDMFDFWYEYRKVVPKGYVRLLGKLAELTDAGIAIHFFVGNHDMWMKAILEPNVSKKLFRNPVSKWLFGIFPPILGIGLANYLSRRSRAAGLEEEVFLGEEKEWLIIYCKEVLAQKKINFFVFGHRHLAIDYRLNEDARYINLGDWMLYYTYAVFNGYTMELKSYKGKDEKIVRN